MENRQEEGKNSVGNVEAKELLCITDGHELKAEECWREWGYRVEGEKREKKMGQL